ncbi:LYR motif-containing protein 4 isoform X2 [Lepisosteus oculatus]|uniref:LYR motif-containing protein 4 isoform X2 n=1 Tax=Lepisosteus oculatus TaxID=7918 RepID=UPI0037116F16
MAASSRSQVLSLYRLLMKESSKFPSYNYRTYALRRVRDAFKENKHVEDSKTVEVLLNKARDNLAVLQRQPFHLEPDWLTLSLLPGNLL